MGDGGRHTAARRFALAALIAVLAQGCATMRNRAPSPDLRPCTDGYAYTADGWKLGVRHLSPAHPDPLKLPVVLCHGMGLNGTFWTITDNHLPSQLLARGYEVFIFDFRGSGEKRQVGADRLKSTQFYGRLHSSRSGEQFWTCRRDRAIRRPGDPATMCRARQDLIASTGSAIAWAGC